LQGKKYAVFSMGDSHYWPKAEDSIYFAKAGIDLDKRLQVEKLCAII
jgi:sulfite reductase (NADPH) hemoprotein beta-component